MGYIVKRTKKKYKLLMKTPEYKSLSNIEKHMKVYQVYKEDKQRDGIDPLPLRLFIEDMTATVKLPLAVTIATLIKPEYGASAYVFLKERRRRKIEERLYTKEFSYRFDRRF